MAQETIANDIIASILSASVSLPFWPSVSLA
jgi:hypothetical protein